MIFIDKREGSSFLYRDFEFPGVRKSLLEITYGDVMFYGVGPLTKESTESHPKHSIIICGIELKSLQDLVSSLSTGRIQGINGQLPGMIDSYDVSVLLVHGRWRQARNGGIDVERKFGGGWSKERPAWTKIRSGDPTTYHQIESFLFECQLSGVIVKNVDNEYGVAAYIYTLYNLLQKPWSGHRQFMCFDNTSLRNNKRRLSLIPEVDDNPCFIRRALVASVLPSIGFDRALSIATHFDSIESMIKTSVDELRGIEGVGDIIAERFYHCVREIYLFRGGQ